MAFDITPAEYEEIDNYIDRLLAAYAAGTLTRADFHWEITEVIACASQDLKGEFWDMITFPLEQRNRKA